MITSSTRALFTALVVFTLISSCAKPLEVTLISRIEDKTRIFALLGTTPYDKDLVISFAKRGLKIKKFSSVKTVTEKSENLDVEYNLAEARYGITLSWTRAMDICLVNSGVKIDVTVEISDLKTNEIVMYIEKGGWTQPCGLRKALIFDDIAAEIDQLWR